MAWNLFDLAWRVAQLVGPIYSGVATGGSATTLVDTVRLQNQFADDWFNLGTLFMVDTTDDLAPKGEMARISDFTQSSGTVTVPAAALTVAPGAGDRYALCGERFNLDRIIDAINQVLLKIPVRTEDITTITTAGSQTEYSLPTGVLGDDIEVYLQGHTSDTDDYQWTPMHNWYISETGTGTAKLLILGSQPITGRLLKIVYLAPHSPLYVYSDKLREDVEINHVIYAAAASLLQDELNMSGSQDKMLIAKLRDMRSMADDWMYRAPAMRPKMQTWGISAFSPRLDEK